MKEEFKKSDQDDQVAVAAEFFLITVRIITIKLT